MAENKITYIGFFQRGKVPFDDLYYENFFPVFRQKIDGRFEEEYPSPDFLPDGLRMKREDASKASGVSNVPLKEINEHLLTNCLVKVSFDEGLADRMGQGDSRYLQICLKKNTSAKNAIFTRKIAVTELLGQAKGEWLEIINVSDLKPLEGYRGYCEVVEQTHLYGSVRVILYDEKSGLYTNAVDADLYDRSHSRNQLIKQSSVRMCTKEQMADNFESITCGNATSEYDGTERVVFYDYVPKTENFQDAELIWEDGQYRIVDKATAGVTAQTDTGTAGDTGEGETTGTKQNGQPAVQEKPLIRDIVASTTDFLRKSGRMVSNADIINYCTCITQSFITTFAGAPGTGKTTLCRLLAKVMGLEEEGDGNSNARYAEISVERGWSSLKDFVGYPNPFPSETTPTVEYGGIIPSNMDACAAFYRMHMDFANENGGKPPYLMLLDEANLSPIEYYWAQFLRNCQLDDEEELQKRKIHVSQTEPWKISPNLRFLATVNFDHTTEELSPRFLDRSWVITLEAPDQPVSRTAEKPEKPEKAITMQELQKAFGFPQEGETFPESVQDTWTGIQKQFRDVKLPLSPRNTQAVENYCIAACRWCDKDYITPEEALDFAVLQKILPTISGYGERFQNLVHGLLDIDKPEGEPKLLQNLPKTRQKLQDMEQAAAENSGFYQFFVR